MRKQAERKSFKENRRGKKELGNFQNKSWIVIAYVVFVSIETVYERDENKQTCTRKKVTEWAGYDAMNRS